MLVKTEASETCICYLMAYPEFYILQNIHIGPLGIKGLLSDFLEFQYAAARCSPNCRIAVILDCYTLSHCFNKYSF